jgi:integrase
MWGQKVEGHMGNLTALKIRSLKQPGRYSDGGGLMLDIGKSGKGSWVVRVQASGRRRDIGLGSSSTLSLADARDAASKVRSEARAGLDPVAVRKKVQEAVPNFREAARLVHSEHKAGWRNGKHQQQWISTLETYAFPALGNKLVSEIEGPVIRDVLAAIWLTKPETARRVRQRIGSILDWAYAKGFRTTEAPMRSLAKGLPRQPRQRGHFTALPYTELPKFLANLRGRISVGRLALEFLILTATRSGEVRTAVWPEIDFKTRLWTIPANRMKAAKVHAVPLSEAALEVLERLRMYHSQSSDLIFSGLNPNRPMSDMTLLKILRDMEIDATVHGFRSTFRDWVADNTNYPGEVAEAALAHAVPNKIEAAYRRTDFLEKRKMLMSDWGNYCS